MNVGPSLSLGAIMRFMRCSPTYSVKPFIIFVVSAAVGARSGMDNVKYRYVISPFNFSTGYWGYWGSVGVALRNVTRFPLERFIVLL